MATSGTRSSRAASAARVTFSPDDRPHRAAHEGEVHGADGDALAGDPPEAPHGGVADAGLALLLAGLLRVRLQIDEAERIERIEPRITLFEGVGVEQGAEPGIHAQAEVVSAAGADTQALLELLVVDHLRAPRTARPELGT